MKAIMSISVDPKMRTLLEDQAIRENRSMTSIIQVLLERHFNLPRSRPEAWTKRTEEIVREMDFAREEVSEIT
jgi:hypothetical protein